MSESRVFLLSPAIPSFSISSTHTPCYLRQLSYGDLLVGQDGVPQCLLRGRNLGYPRLVVEEVGCELQGVWARGIEELHRVLNVLLVGLLDLQGGEKKGLQGRSGTVEL